MSADKVAKRDPKPWHLMTPAEKKAHAARLREEAKTLAKSPTDDSLEILRRHIQVGLPK